MSQNTRAEVLAELKATPRLPGWIDGIAYEVSHEMSRFAGLERQTIGSRCPRYGAVDGMDADHLPRGRTPDVGKAG